MPFRRQAVLGMNIKDENFGDLTVCVTPQNDKKGKKRPGRKPGHPGECRAVPTQIHQEIEQPLIEAARAFDGLFV